MTPIEITNHGQLIVATNYWDSPMEEAGKMLVSPNAGAIRILVPRAVRRIIQEMRGAEYTILSRGPWPDEGLDDAVEILFEDHSDSPFALHLSPESFVMLPAEPPADQGWLVTVWDVKRGKPHKCLERRCHWRRAPKIPWMKPLDV